MKNCLLPALLIFFSSFLQAQVVVSGRVFDQEGPLPGATVRVLNKDSAFVTAAITGAEGDYSVTVAPNSRYTLMFSYFAYRAKGNAVPIVTGTANIEVPKVTMKEAALNLKEVEVVTLQERGEQREDTTSFRADAYKVNPDASAEDLVKKMPGITSDNEGVKVNGEQVQKILVDGKPFFGDDPNAALKNLPAEIIDKVEVFDRLSDQSQFTGFNDGEQQKTINIVTKKGANVGQFGRIYAGGGADADGNFRHNSGAALNSFRDKQRVSALLLLNNVNQQNFSASDISGAMGSSKQQGRQGRGGRNSPGANLMASPQAGNSITRSAGINYSDEWGEKIEISGSYFFNNTDNRNLSDIRRNYFTENNLVYRQQNDDRSLNMNHRLNFKFEYTIDSANKLIVHPTLTMQDHRSTRSLRASNTVGDQVPLSETATDAGNFNHAYDFNNNLQFQHKFPKKGRTISLNLRTDINNRDANGDYYSQNKFSDTSQLVLDQEYITEGRTTRITPNLAYTEPLAKSLQLQFSYNPSYTESRNDKQTYDFAPAENEHTLFNPSLSNKYSNVYTTQKGGLSLRMRTEKLNFNLGADLQQSVLRGEQTFPNQFTLSQHFENILPNAMLNYKFSKTRNIRLYYRSRTDIPNVNQLQNVVDISNPLQLSTGNPALKQTFENFLNLRAGGIDPKTQRNVMLFANLSFIDNYISNATSVLKSDTLIQNVQIRSGSQLTRPVNLDGYHSLRTFLVYGMPVKQIRSNVNLSAGVNYNHVPALINNLLNFSNSYAGNAGITIGSNISKAIDFSLSYNGNYTVVRNSRQKTSDNDFYSHNTSAKVNWLTKNSFVFSTEGMHSSYRGLTSSFNQSFLIWNASAGYKLLNKKALEIRFAAFDILNKNRSISRTVNAAYTEDSFTSVLGRHFLVTLVYTLRNFKGNEPENNNAEDGNDGSGNGGRRRN